MRPIPIDYERIELFKRAIEWTDDRIRQNALPARIKIIMEIKAKLNNMGIDLQKMKLTAKQENHTQTLEVIENLIRQCDRARKAVMKHCEIILGTAGTVNAPKAIVNTQLARKDEIQPELDFASVQGNEIELKLDKKSVEELNSPEAGFIFDGIYKCLTTDATGKPILATYIEGDRPEVSYFQIEAPFDTFCAIAGIAGDMRGKVKTALFGHKRILQSVMLKIKATQKIVIPTFLHGELAEADRIAMPRILNQGDKLQTIDVVELGLVRIKVNALIFEHILKEKGEKLIYGGFYTLPKNFRQKQEARLRSINVAKYQNEHGKATPLPEKMRLTDNLDMYCTMQTYAMMQWATGRDTRTKPLELSYKAFVGLHGVAENKTNKHQRILHIMRLHTLCGEALLAGEAFEGCDKIGYKEDKLIFIPKIKEPKPAKPKNPNT